MNRRQLVPVKHHLQVHAGGDARAQVERYAQQHGELADVSPDPGRPYRNGDPTVHVVATIYEPTPAPAPRPVPWVPILWAATGLVLALVLLVAAIVDVYLLVGALTLTGLLFLAHQSDKAGGR
jgi:hypothetical protein